MGEKLWLFSFDVECLRVWEVGRSLAVVCVCNSIKYSYGITLCRNELLSGVGWYIKANDRDEVMKIVEEFYR